MKGSKLKTIIAGLMLFMSISSNAQISGLLNNVLGKTKTQTENTQSNSTLGNTISSVFQNLIGTASLTNKSLSGTWEYESPAVVFESSNLLQKAGGSVITGTLENTMQKYLSKIGFTPGKVKINFDGEKSFTMTIGTKTIKGQYTVNENTITFSREGLLNYPVSANVAVAINELQITFKADKLLEFFTKIASTTNNATITSIAKIAGSYEGMQLGFQFKK